MSTAILESLLELQSKHPYYHDFILHLQHTFCLENLLFIQDVQDYRSSTTLKKYQRLVSRYILVNSPHEINIPCDMRQALLSKTTTTIKPTKDVFDEAAEAILELMNHTFLPWWQQQQQQQQQQHNNNNVKKRRNTLTSSFSVPEHRWHHHMFSSVTTRPSFSSLRDVSSSSSLESISWQDHLDKHNNKKNDNLFSRKKQALLYCMKRTFTIGGGSRSGSSGNGETK